MKNKAIAIFFILFLISCRTVPQLGGFIPRVRVSQSKKYKIIQKAETSMSSYQFFGFATVTTLPSFDRAIREKASELGGDDMINVTWYRIAEVFPAGSVYYVMIRGTVIKFIE